MTLENLLGIRLEAITADPIMIQKLLQAANSGLKDAAVEQLSNETRFDVAYKAIMQLANAALQANGYRTLTSVPGHHQTMIQSLPKTIGLPRGQMIQLDTLRKQRNLADYSGAQVTDQECAACIKLAADLSQNVRQWLTHNHPDLVD
ncbi:MAG: hypothetical protein ACRBB6_04005 [Neptuniibacter sp.]